MYPVRKNSEISSSNLKEGLVGITQVVWGLYSEPKKNLQSVDRRQIFVTGAVELLKFWSHYIILHNLTIYTIQYLCNIYKISDTLRDISTLQKYY